MKAASEVSEWTKGPPSHAQTWWRSEEVGKKVSGKKLKFKVWRQAKGTTDEKTALMEYVMAKKIAKKVIAQAQPQERKRFREKLNKEEGQ